MSRKKTALDMATDSKTRHSASDAQNPTHRITLGTFRGHLAGNVRTLESWPAWRRITVMYHDGLRKETDVLAQYLQPILHFATIVRDEASAKPIRDLRRRVHLVIVEYKDHEGIPYRKSFECAVGKEPEIPLTGTHEELNAKAVQK